MSGFSGVRGMSVSGMGFVSGMSGVSGTSCVSGVSCISCVNCVRGCLLYTSPSPRDGLLSRMPSSA